MIAVEGIFDGKRVIFKEEIPVKSPYRVIITFLEQVGDAESLRDFTAAPDGFDFWNDEREDLYQDYLPS